MNALILLPFLFVMALLWYYRNNKQLTKIVGRLNAIGIGMLIYLIIFSVFANVFYYHPDFSISVHAGNGTTSVEAVFYFFLIYMILLLPFLTNNVNDFQRVVFNPGLIWFIRIIALSSFFVALLQLPNAIEGLHHMKVDLAGYKEDVFLKHENIGSGITSIPVLLYSFFRSVLPLTVFYYLAFRPNKKEIILISLATFVTPLINTLATGVRESIVFVVIDFLLGYMFFFPFLKKETKHIMNNLFMVFGGIVFGITIWMSYLRFSDVRFDASFWVFKYMGEGFVNFNTLLYERVGDPLYGSYNLPFFRDLLGIDDFSSVQAQRQHLSSLVNFDPTLFYSIIGAILVDWGKIGGFIFTLIIVGFICCFSRKKKGTVLFSQLILLHFFATICMKGVFYFHLRSEFGGSVILMMIILCCFLKYVQRT